MSKKVIIRVSGGIADVVDMPEDVVVEIRDYDIEGCCHSEELLKTDKDGDHYHKTIHTGS